jgi:hypothetical protein
MTASPGQVAGLPAAAAHQAQKKRGSSADECTYRMPSTGRGLQRSLALPTPLGRHDCSAAMATPCNSGSDDGARPKAVIGSRQQERRQNSAPGLRRLEVHSAGDRFLSALVQATLRASGPFRRARL